MPKFQPMTEEIKRQLQRFFPSETFTVETLETALEKGEIVTAKEKILPYLQTALFDDPGEYLTDMTHLVTLPLEPGLGNLHLRYSRFIVLRMFTKAFAVEMATTFEELGKVQEIPVLRLTYPVLARIVRNTREFRAKVIESLNFTVSLELGENAKEFLAAPVDISIRGMSFAVSKQDQRNIKINESYGMKLYLDDELRVSVGGTVKHLSRIRKKSGIEYVCGIEFDLPSKTTAAVIESLVAMIQRAHLKELADKSAWSGIDLIA